MNEVIGYWVNLNSLADDFLNKFSKYIEKKYRMKHLLRVICQFVQFRNNNWCWFLIIQRPKSKINTSICDINNIFIISHKNFEMMPRNVIRARYGQTAAIFIASRNSTLEKVSHLVRGFKRISSNNCMLIFQFWAKLKF